MDFKVKRVLILVGSAILCVCYSILKHLKVKKGLKTETLKNAGDGSVDIRHCIRSIHKSPCSRHIHCRSSHGNLRDLWFLLYSEAQARSHQNLLLPLHISLPHHSPQLCTFSEQRPECVRVRNRFATNLFPP